LKESNFRVLDFDYKFESEFKDSNSQIFIDLLTNCYQIRSLEFTLSIVQ
jgi:hypothetical protein